MMLWILDEKDQPAAVGLEEWTSFYLSNPGATMVARDDIAEITVSTIFVAVGPVPCWETMVFGGPLDKTQWRYRNKQAALRGHLHAIELVKLANRGEKAAKG